MTVELLTKKDFDKKIKDIAIIKFTATWCAPCKHLAPIYKEVSNEIKVHFYEVDVDEEPELAQEFGIMSVPTTVILKSKQEVLRINGTMSKEEFKKRLLSKI